VLPPELEASEPPEARGIARDEVKLLVSHRASARHEHARFRDLPRFLTPGDVLAINTSGTLPAAVDALRADGESIELHFSTRLQASVWSVELRRLTPDGTRPLLDGKVGETLQLLAGGRVTLRSPHVRPEAGAAASGQRLWIAAVFLPLPSDAYLHRFGFPIRYGYVPQPWPLSCYQSVFVTEPGSAEMPSAGRALTPELISRLVAQGIRFAPLLLHTGVASLESHEPPYPEFFRVPAESTAIVNLARAEGKRVIAVGTTVARALESAVAADGTAESREGWTDRVITPRTGTKIIDGILTGLHEPQATHLALLEAVGGRPLLQQAYREMLAHRYLWHEFGDLHLILP